MHIAKACQISAEKTASSVSRLAAGRRGRPWVLIKGGCSGRGVQWIGVVLCSKLVHHII